MEDVTLTEKLNNIVNIGVLYVEVEAERKLLEEKIRNKKQGIIGQLISTYEAIDLFWSDKLTPSEIECFKNEFRCVFQLYFPEGDILINERKPI